MKASKHKIIVVILALIAVYFGIAFAVVFFAQSSVQSLLDRTFAPLRGESFDTTESALIAYDEYETELNDIDLDFSPPYEYVDTIYIEDMAIIIYQYREGFRANIAMMVMEKKGDGRWAFTNGFCYLDINTDGDKYWQDGARNYTNIIVSNKKYAICFSWLPIDSEKDIYVDGVKSDKVILNVSDGNEDIQIYLCYALSKKYDYLLGYLFSDNDGRHKYVLR